MADRYQEPGGEGLSLEQRTLERIDREFQGSDKASAVELLGSYAGPEAARVIWDILELSKCDLEKMRDCIQLAKTDYRDALYWAEYYYETDPILRGRDPKKLVDELIAKWGEQKEGTNR